AKSITGDLMLANERIMIGFVGFPMIRLRVLKEEELIAAFGGEGEAAGSGSLYKLSIPPEKKFSHNNTLCGQEETQWMATYLVGRTLQIAFFSGATLPVFTREALANSTNLCGTYTYVK